MRFVSIASVVAVSAALAFSGTTTASAFGHGGGHGGGFGGGHGGFHGGFGGGRGFGGRGFGGGFGGFGYGGYGYGVAGYDDGFYGQDYYAGNYDYSAGQYGYGYGPGYGYGQPGYGAGVQYSEAPDDAPVRTGRSAATVGGTCSTPVKACTLYNQSYVGGGCSCKVSGGRSRGRVTP
jgi:hypothetical protein